MNQELQLVGANSSLIRRNNQHEKFVGIVGMNKGSTSEPTSHINFGFTSKQSIAENSNNGLKSGKARLQATNNLINNNAKVTRNKYHSNNKYNPH